MRTDEPTVQQWQQILTPDGPAPGNTADLKSAEADIEAMRRRLKVAVDACTDLAMDQAVLILENHRLRRQLKEAQDELTLKSAEIRRQASREQAARELEKERWQ